MSNANHIAKIPSYVASAVAAMAGSSVSLCDREVSYDHKFTLVDVPEAVSLGDISRHVMTGHGFDESSLAHVTSRGEYFDAAVCSGRARLPHSTIEINRMGHRVHVQVKPHNYIA